MTVGELLEKINFLLKDGGVKETDHVLVSLSVGDGVEPHSLESVLAPRVYLKPGYECKGAGMFFTTLDGKK